MSRLDLSSLVELCCFICVLTGDENNIAQTAKAADIEVSQFCISFSTVYVVFREENER